MNNRFRCSGQHKRKSNVWAGIILLAIGGVLLAKQFGVLFPYWLFTWPMILILIGLFVGVKNNFQDMSGVVMIAIGLVFLLDKMYPELPVKQFAWPVLIIGAGLVLILVPRRRRSRLPDEEPLPMQTIEMDKSTAFVPSQENISSSAEEILDIVAIFGGIKKRILSKNFRGGEIVSVFGGSEVNLSQADFNRIIEIEIVQIFGGTKLIIPANWEVRSECFVMLGGIDDKRSQPSNSAPEKILILKGTTICGGIEIKSYY